MYAVQIYLWEVKVVSKMGLSPPVLGLGFVLFETTGGNILATNHQHVHVMLPLFQTK